MTSLRLTRASQDVQSFLSVLGGLRETRLTAVLGFLVAQFPTEFGVLLGFRHASTDEILVEDTDEGDRYDVLIRQSGETHIIEGKVGPTQSVTQLLRYIQSLRRRHGRKPSLTVVDDGSEFRHSQDRAFDAVKRRVKALKFVTWTQVAAVCRDIVRKKRNHATHPTGVVIAQEFAIHLKENHMTKDTHPEIYLRDVGDIESVRLYFRHRIYKCQSKFFPSARNNLYFAPYFTQPMAKAISAHNLVPVGEGISFVSRVEDVQVMDTADVMKFLKAQKHPEFEEVAKIIRKQHKEPDVLLMRLGEPRQLFTSPVTKTKLSKKIRFGVGAMGSRSCTFDDLLSASQC
jgi:hypothetical protein